MKVPYTFLILWIFNCTVQAQSWEVGFHAGENLSTLTGDQQNDYRLGFVGGVFAGHYLTEKLLMRLELNLERKGASNELRDPLNPGPDFVPNYRLDYMSLPVMLRYYTGTNIRFLMGAGVSVNYLLKGSAEYTNTSSDLTEEFRRTDTELLACAGAGYPLSKNIVLSIELRSLWGLVEVDKPTGVANDLGRNLSWGLMAGFNYHFQ